MSTNVVSVGPSHTIREAAQRMRARGVGSVVVMDSDTAGAGILTERDVLLSVAGGEDPDTERVGEHLTAELVHASPQWDLTKAAAAMVRGGFRHLVVVEGSDVVGVLSVRDIVRVWSSDGDPQG